MRIASSQLIDDLTEMIRQQMNAVETMRQLPLDRLNAKPAPDAWSALECIEHLNRYAAFYLPLTRNKVAQNAHRSARTTYQSGWLGNYLAVNILPSEGMRTMRTFKSKDPSGSSLDTAVLDRFLADADGFLQVLKKARSVDIQRIRTKTTLGMGITLRLGDTLRFVIHHQERHLVQARRALEAAA